MNQTPFCKRILSTTTMVSPKSRSDRLTERIQRTRRHRQWAARHMDASVSSSGTSDTQETGSTTATATKPTAAAAPAAIAPTAAPTTTNEPMARSRKVVSPHQGSKSGGETLSQRRNRLMNRRKMVNSPAVQLKIAQSYSQDSTKSATNALSPSTLGSEGSAFSEHQDDSALQQHRKPPPVEHVQQEEAVEVALEETDFTVQPKAYNVPSYQRAPPAERPTNGHGLEEEQPPQFEKKQSAQPPWARKQEETTTTTPRAPWMKPQAPPPPPPPPESEPPAKNVAPWAKRTVEADRPETRGAPWLKPQQSFESEPGRIAVRQTPEPAPSRGPVAVGKVTQPSWIKKSNDQSSKAAPWQTIQLRKTASSSSERNVAPEPQAEEEEQILTETTTAPPKAPWQRNNGGSRVVASWQNAQLNKTKPSISTTWQNKPTEARRSPVVAYPDPEPGELPSDDTDDEEEGDNLSPRDEIASQPSWSRSETGPQDATINAKPRAPWQAGLNTVQSGGAVPAKPGKRLAPWEKPLNGSNQGGQAFFRSPSPNRLAPWQQRKVVEPAEEVAEEEPGQPLNSASFRTPSPSQLAPWQQRKVVAAEGEPSDDPQKLPTVSSSQFRSPSPNRLAPWQQRKVVESRDLNNGESSDRGVSPAPPNQPSSTSARPLAPWQQRKTGGASGTSSFRSSSPSGVPSWQQRKVVDNGDSIVDEKKQIESEAAQEQQAQEETAQSAVPAWRRNSTGSNSAPGRRLAPWEKPPTETAPDDSQPKPAPAPVPAPNRKLASWIRDQNNNNAESPETSSLREAPTRSRGRLAPWEKPKGDETSVQSAPVRARSPLRRAPWEKPKENQPETASGEPFASPPMVQKSPSWQRPASADKSRPPTWQPPSRAQSSKSVPSWVKRAESTDTQEVQEVVSSQGPSEAETPEPVERAQPPKPWQKPQNSDAAVSPSPTGPSWQRPSPGQRSASMPSGRLAPWERPKQNSYVKPGFTGTRAGGPKLASWIKQEETESDIVIKATDEQPVSPLSETSSRIEPERPADGINRTPGRLQQPPWMKKSSARQVPASNSWRFRSDQRQLEAKEDEVVAPEMQPPEQEIRAEDPQTEDPQRAETPAARGVAIIETPKAVSVANLRASFGSKPAAPPVPGTAPPAAAAKVRGDSPWLAGNRKANTARSASPSVSPRMSSPVGRWNTSSPSVQDQIQTTGSAGSLPLPRNAPPPQVFETQSTDGRSTPVRSNQQPSWSNRATSAPVSAQNLSTPDADGPRRQELQVTPQEIRHSDQPQGVATREVIEGAQTEQVVEGKQTENHGFVTPQQSRHVATPTTGDSGKSLAALAADTFVVADYDHLADRQYLDSEDDDSLLSGGFRASTPQQSEVPTEFRDIVTSGSGLSPQDSATTYSAGSSPSRQVFKSAPTVSTSSPQALKKPIPRLSPSRKDTDVVFARRHRSSPPSASSSPSKVSPDKASPTRAQDMFTPIDRPREQTEVSPEALDEIRDRYVDAPPPEESDAGSSSAVFGVPETFGAAGGDEIAEAPKVSDRAKAIEDWNGGVRSPTFSEPSPSILRTPTRSMDAQQPQSNSPGILRRKPPTPANSFERKSVRFSDQTARERGDPQDIMPVDSEDQADSDVVFGDPNTFGAAGVGGVNSATSSPSIADRGKAIEGWKGGRGRKLTPDRAVADQNSAGASHVLTYWSNANQSDREDYENHQQWADLDPDFVGLRDDSPSPEPIEPDVELLPSATPNSTPVMTPDVSPDKPARKQPAAKESQKHANLKVPDVFDPFFDDDESIIFHDNESSFFSATSLTEEEAKPSNENPFRVILPPPRKSPATRARRQREASRDYDDYYARHMRHPHDTHTPYSSDEHWDEGRVEI